jgi:hypothetical protein
MPALAQAPIIHEEIASWMTFWSLHERFGLGRARLLRPPADLRPVGRFVGGRIQVPTRRVIRAAPTGRVVRCTGVSRDAYFASNRCRRRSCARRVLFLKKACSIHATLITSQKVPVPYLASASAQMPRAANAAERTSPPMRNWRGVMLRMVLLIRGARQPLDPWGDDWCIKGGDIGRGWRRFEHEA